jgi:hypothetical protein
MICMDINCNREFLRWMFTPSILLNVVKQSSTCAKPSQDA